MKAEIRRFHSPDVPDLAGYQPNDPGVFGVLVQVLAGPSDAPGEEAFDLVVCSPKWFEAQLDHGDVRSVRHHMMTLNWNWSAIQHTINKLVSACEADTWSEVAQLVGRLGRWEFEHYRP